MNFNEKLIELRKSKNLSQDELGDHIQVSRQTISKWETGQSYPDFQRLVLLSDYFGLTLDALVKDIELEDVRNKNLTESQVTAIYDDVQKAKSSLRKFKRTTYIVCGVIAGIYGLFALLVLYINLSAYFGWG